MFWAFLWGPVGLLLAVPLTVCLVVLGEHIPSLGFLRTLLGDAPAVDPGALFFHRALVGDYDGAAVLIGEQVDTPLVEVYEKVLIPALTQAKTERDNGGLESEEVRRVYRTARSVLTGVLASRRPRDVDSGKAPVVIGCAADGAWDRIAIGMFRDIMAEVVGELVVLTPANLLAEIDRRKGDGITVCIAALAPGGLSRAARLCEQVRARKSGARVVVGRWGSEADRASAEKLLKSTGATRVTWTLAETIQEVAPDKNPATEPSPAPSKAN